MNVDEMEMSDLVKYHNELASNLGREQSSSFKSKAAAKAAILKLEALKGQETVMTEETTAPAQPENAPPFDPNAPVAPVAPVVPTAASPMNSVNRRGPTQGVGEFCKKLILEGKTNQEILAAVATFFKGTAKTSNSCIAFYRNALKGGAASRPRSGKVDIASLEAKAAKLAETIAQAKAAAIAKAQAEALAKAQAEALAKLQAEALAKLQAEQPTQQPAAQAQA